MDDKHLGKLLVDSGRLSEETLRILQEEQARLAREGGPVPTLADLLNRRALVPPEVVRDLERTPGPLAERIAAARAEPSRRLGKFLLLDELGQGGMGVVYRAWQEDLRRVVAVKVLARKDDAELSARFLREARLASRLRHPNIVTVFEFGETDGRAWFAMDLIDGRPFDRIDADARTCASLLAKVARGLDYAHGQGIIHRDVKPSNILVGADGAPYLTDFGLARDLGSESRLTTSGALLGTPAYMSPEQAAALPVDARTDVYGLGATLYYGLARRPPHESETVLGLVESILVRDPSPPSRDARLNIIALKCLEKNSTRRYASAGKLADDLERWLDGRPIEARPPGAATLAGRWARRRWLPISATSAALVIAVLLLLLARKTPDASRWYSLEPQLQDHLRKKDFAAARDALAKFVPANSEEKRLAAEMDARLRREIDDESGRLAARARDLAARDRFDEAVLEIRRARAWGVDTTAVETEIERSRAKFDEEARAALAGPDPLKHLERFGHTPAWEKASARIDRLLFESGETTDLPGRPRRTGQTLHWKYEFRDPAGMIDWSLRPLDIPTSPGYGMRADAGGFYLRNGSVRFQTPLEGDLRMTARFRVRERGHPMMGIQLGGYLWIRNREFSVVIAPSGAELGGITSDIPKEGDSLEVTMRISHGTLLVLENGATVKRIALPEPILPISPDVSANRNTAVHVESILVSGRIREGWEPRSWTVDPGLPKYELLNPNSERKFRVADEGTWETTPDGFRGTARDDQRAELHAEDFRNSRVRFRYRLEQGRYLELRIRAGTRELLYQLPADQSFGWREVEALGFEGEGICVVDGRVRLDPVDQQARTADGPLLRIAARGRVTIADATLEELRGLPRESFWKDLERLELGSGWTRDGTAIVGTGEIRSLDAWRDAEFDVGFQARPGSRITVGARGREIATFTSGGEGPDGFRLTLSGRTARIEGPRCFARTELSQEPGPFFLKVEGEPIEVLILRVRNR